MTDQNDRIVEDYLTAVRRATADLAAAQRDELLADLTEHIATARAELDPETEAGVRAILGRLGNPANIAAEARLDRPPVPPVPPVSPVSPAPSRTTRNIVLILITVFVIPVLVCVGAIALIAALLLPASTTQEPSVATPVATAGR